MAKTWYPIINYEKCAECGVCVEHCSHGVYNKIEAPRPVVVSPDNCVEYCTGCGSLCPAEAIEYFGDSDIGTDDCCCSGSDEKDIATRNGSESGCGCNGGCCSGK